MRFERVGRERTNVHVVFLLGTNARPQSTIPPHAAIGSDLPSSQLHTTNSQLARSLNNLFLLAHRATAVSGRRAIASSLPDKCACRTLAS